VPQIVANLEEGSLDGKLNEHAGWQLMMTQVILPKSGMGIEEGTVVKWLKAVGDMVEKEEVLIEIETAKAVQEVLAPASGILAEILVAAGETVPVNTPLGTIRNPQAP
jgi:pyruvate/2-oxoglutarate dehydrogenase complex dihydrolipoamide acyltransferase (E2) component